MKSIALAALVTLVGLFIYLFVIFADSSKGDRR